MRFRLALCFLSVVSLSVGTFLACNPPASGGNGKLKTKTLDSGTDDENQDTNQPTDVVKAEADPVLPDGSKPAGKVYAHSATSLYLLEPISKQLTKVGDFTCLAAGDRLLDLAVTKDGKVFGTSDRNFIQITPENATCTKITNFDQSSKFPNSLGFVPKGTVDDNAEALVGYKFDTNGNATVYVRVDLPTGAVSIVPSVGLNPPDALIKWKAAGDIIGLIRDGNKAYLTVSQIDEPTGLANDFLAEVDPKTGTIITILGDTGHRHLYGLAQWAGTGFAFDDTGEVVTMDLVNTSPFRTSVLQVAIETDGAPIAWFGAGVTTDSPTKP